MLKLTYTKDNGDISERYGLIVSDPSKLAMMLDLTGLSESERKEVELEWVAYKADVAKLKSKYSVFNYIKSFKQEGISNRQLVCNL